MAELRGFVGITRKKQIGDLIEHFPVLSEKIIADFGEDAAVIDDGDDVLLFAADGIWSKLMEADPEWSGYCSVLVNVHDIAAMGGWPIAMVDVLSVSSPRIAEAVLRGMKKGIEKFNVPIIGGHLHPDTPYSALDVAILGKARKDSVILSSTARPGDAIVAAADLDGAPHPKFAINFDSTSFKEGETLARQLGSMRELGERHLVTAGKDISNPGLLGTLGMLLETSGVGAVVDLDFIPVPAGLQLSDWLKMYPGMGFVVTAKQENVHDVIDVFRRSWSNGGQDRQHNGRSETGHSTGHEGGSALRFCQGHCNRDQVSIVDSDFVKSLQDRARSRHARIGIGIKNLDADLISGLEAATEYADLLLVGDPCCDCALDYITPEDPATELVDLLARGEIDGAVRGNISASKAMRALSRKFDIKVRRMALLDLNGWAFFLAPVGIDEGETLSDKLNLVLDGAKFLQRMGISPTVSVLSGGRVEDVGRSRRVDRSLAEGEFVAARAAAQRA